MLNKKTTKKISENARYTEAEITVIRELSIPDGEWSTSHFPYMTDQQIIEIHRYMYGRLIVDVQRLRGGKSIGDIFVPIMVKNLLIETNKRFKDVKPN